MSQPKSANGATTGQRPSGIILPSADEVRRFGGIQEPRPSDPARKVLIDGLEHALGKIQDRLRERRTGCISDEVHVFVDKAKARSLLGLGFSFQVLDDDRLGENMDIALAMFDMGTRIAVLGREHPVERFQRALHLYGNDVAEFLMRVPSEYVKLMVYYCKLGSFDEIAAVVQHKGKMQFRLGDELARIFQDPIELICSIPSERVEYLLKTLNVTSMNEFNKLFFGDPDLIRLIYERNWGVIRKCIEIADGKTVDGFQAIFSDDKLFSVFRQFRCDGHTGDNFVHVVDSFGVRDLPALKAFLSSDFSFYALSSTRPEDLKAYVAISEAATTAEFNLFLRALPGEARGVFFVQNLSEVKARFSLGTLDKILGFLAHAKLAEALGKADPKNLRIMFRVTPFRDLTEFCAVLSDPVVADRLKNAKYQPLLDLLDVLSKDEDKKSAYMRSLISSLDSESFQNAELLLTVVKAIRNPPEELVDLVYEVLLSKVPEQNSDVFIGLAQDGLLSRPGNVKALRHLMAATGGVLTDYLAREVIAAENHITLIRAWKDVIASFEYGCFDHVKKLHRNLEYVRYCRIVQDERIRRHMAHSVLYEDYVRIFTRPPKAKAVPSAQDSFEIACVAHEARLLRDYILQVNRVASAQGRRTLVVPNLSYGYLPLSPLVEELSEQGIEVVIGAKVGSTECHNNPDYTPYRLFKRHRTEIVNAQPVILIIDGTRHMTEERSGHSARYPDAYQGFLNHVIALNDACGFTGVDYSRHGKLEENLHSLRADSTFEKTVQRYASLRKEGNDLLPYSFGFWNTAGLSLSLRSNRFDVTESKPLQPNEISGPTIIFVNVGVLHEQLPEHLRSSFNDVPAHIPAYFDDSGRIIFFDFGFDNYGVRYANNLETEVRKAYGCVNPEQDAEFSASLYSLVARTIPSKEP